MKSIKKKIWALMSAAVTTSALVVSMTGSSVTTVRDADGDGRYTGSDATLTLRYLKGEFNPSSVRSFDFDGNGIISYVDALKVLGYYSGSFRDDSLPGPVGADSTATSTTSYYFRHDCSDTNKRSYTEYSLTVDALDNSSAQNNAVSPRTIIGEDIREADTNETAIVRLFNPNDGKNIGTGFIVGDHIVATAAHCVRDGNDYADLAVKIVDEDFDVIRIVRPEYIHVPKSAVYNHSDINGNYDYALLYFDESLSQYGTFQMGVATDDYIEQNGGVVVSGFTSNYPEDYTGSSENVRFKSSGNLYYSTFFDNNSITEKNKYRCFYDADSEKGNSGGPVYVEERYDIDNVAHKYKTVVAIHSGGTSQSYDYFDPNYNSGVRVTPDLLKFYYENTYLTD